MSKKTGKSNGANANVNTVDKNLKVATDSSVKKLDKTSDEVDQKLAPVTTAQTRSILRDCLHNARNDFLDSIGQARQEFLQAIRNAF